MSGRQPRNDSDERRAGASSVIQLPRDRFTREIPNATTHAKRFVLGVSLVILAGALLLMMPFATESGDVTHPVDAFFTSMSATSVTGLVTVDTATHWSFFGELVILLLIQLGGFGFMVGTSLVLILLGRGGSLRDTMMIQDGSPTMSLHDVSALSFRIVRFMLVAEAIGAVLLTGHFLRSESFATALWQGIFHSISAFCNAGFDLQGDYRSFGGAGESPVVLVTIGALVQAGALSYMVLHDVWTRRNWRLLQLDSKLVLITNALLIIGGTVMFVSIEWNAALAHMAPEWKPINGLFQAIASRTAGFSTVELSETHPSTLFLWVGGMLIGGAAGSTAGGIKLATLAVLFLAVISTLRGQEEPQAFGRRITSTLVFRAMTIFALFMATHFLLTLGLAISEDVFNDASFGFMQLMFEAMSGMSTAGLSTGITPDFSVPGKIILFAGMFIGRLGPITAAYALQRRQHPARYRFPEAHIRIG